MKNISEKFNHPGFQKYFKNTSWMLLGRIFSLALSFFVSVYTARNLGTENFGALNFIISFTGIAGTTLFAIDSIVLKKLNEKTDDINKILGSSFAIKSINALVSITVSVVAALVLTKNLETVFLVFIFSLYTIFQAINSVDLYFKARADVKEAAIASMCTNIVTSAVRVAIVATELPIVFLLLSYAFDTALSAISYIILYKRNFGKVTDWKIDWSLVREIIGKSWPFTISAFATAIYLSVDQVFLKFMLGEKSVGLYVVAVRFSEVWFVISSVLTTALLPAILNSQRTDYEVFISRSRKLYTLLFYTSVVICIGIFTAAPFIINTLYGSAYAESVVLLRIYIWSIVGMFLSTGLQQMLLALDKFKSISALNFIGMALSLTLNPLFINLFGVEGAAFANICTYTIPVIVLLYSGNLKDQRKALFSGIFKPFQSLRV